MKIAAVAVAVATLAGSAFAETINGTFTGVSPGQSISIRFNGHNSNTSAGGFNFLRNAANPGTLSGFAPTFQGFCIDLTEYVSNGHSYQFQTFSLANSPTSDAGPMGAARAARLGRLFADHYAGLASAANQAQAYAAFQIAVWEIVHDDGLNIYDGPFRVTDAPSGTRSLAQSWLSTVCLPGPTMSLIAIDDPAGHQGTGHQGYVMVPTPGAAALVGAGLLGLNRRRR
ncbi:MAG: Cys-Gln thioester bond-forming surface protein [Phycisphaerales bacterium]